MTVNKSGIINVQVTNFRSYNKLKVNCDTRTMVITGNNGAGKTNILEAISMFCPIKSMRNGKLSTLINNDRENNPYTDDTAVNITIKNNNISNKLGVGIVNSNTLHDKKIFRINGENTPKNVKLHNYINILFLTPQMDKIFIEGIGAKRKFFDKLTGTFFPNHPIMLNQYEHFLRERMIILKKNKYLNNSAWLSSLEYKISELAIAIAATRLEFIEMLSQVQFDTLELFPTANFFIDGECEQNLQHMSATYAEETLCKNLFNNRINDLESGKTANGIHRSNFQVIFANKNMDSAQCSTGEQKALLLSIIMSAAKLQILKKYATPILLLDEVVAHLDEKRRQLLIQEILNLNIQAWITGTDGALFHNFKDKIQLSRLINSNIIYDN